MRTFLFLMLIFCLPSFNVDGQIKMINATKQSWAGGICCVSGTRYTFDLVVQPALNRLVLDTLWVGNDYWVINELSKDQLEIKKDAQVTHYLIHVGVSIDNRILEYNHDLYRNPNRPVYIGEACLTYHTLTDKYVFPIISLTELPIIEYP